MSSNCGASFISCFVMRRPSLKQQHPTAGGSNLPAAPLPPGNVLSQTNINESSLVTGRIQNFPAHNVYQLEAGMFGCIQGWVFTTWVCMKVRLRKSRHRLIEWHLKSTNAGQIGHNILTLTIDGKSHGSPAIAASLVNRGHHVIGRTRTSTKQTWLSL